MRLRHYLLGVDIGGTFTDFVLADPDSGHLVFHKLLTATDDPTRTLLEGTHQLLEHAHVRSEELTMVVHGTTLASNTILERKGPPTALLTTKGFRDVLEIGSEQRYDIHDLFLQFTDPLVPRHARVEVSERIDRDGMILRPLRPEEVHAAVAPLPLQGVEAVAVVLLHSYANPAHEQMAARVLKEQAPELGVALSHAVSPEIGEYERASTTVANAYLMPVIGSYLDNMERRLAGMGINAPLYVMSSAGGNASPSAVAAFPVRMLESGAAGGVMGAAEHARSIGATHVLSFDMGGTTAKISLIVDGRPAVVPGYEVARAHRFRPGSGLPIRTPAVDLLEVGGGGGSIARVDSMGLVRVGPDSAGANPGPACYGRGGREPTVTDAALLLGYLRPDAFLGGRLPLDAEAARRAIASRIAEPLKLPPATAAWRIYALVCETMAAAARVHCGERGVDPRGVTLLAFGGAGPMHAARIARILGTPHAVIPPGAGVTAAYGFLVSPLAFHFARSFPGLLDGLDWPAVASIIADMEREGRGLLAAAGLSPAEIVIARTAEVCLRGQTHRVMVPVPDGDVDGGAAASMGQAFAAEYRRLYHHPLPDGHPIQVVTWRVVASQRQAPGAARYAGAPNGGAGMERVEPRAMREAYFPATGWTPTRIYERRGLRSDSHVRGPAIVEEPETTTIVPPGVSLQVDPHGHLVLSLRTAGGGVA